MPDLGGSDDEAQPVITAANTTAVMAAVTRCTLLMANSPLASIMTAVLATPEAFPSLRFRALALLLDDAGEGVHEVIDVGVGHGQRAAAETALRQQHAFVDEAEEGAQGPLTIGGTRRAMIAQLLLRPVDPEERAEPCHLRLLPLLVQHVAHPAAKLVAKRIEPRVALRHQFLHRRHPACHGDGVCIEGAAVADLALAPARIVGVHYLLAAAEGAHGEAAADDLAEGGQVGTDAEALLGAAFGDAEGDDLVEDEHDAVAVGDLAQSLEEAQLRHEQAGVGHERIHDEGGDVPRVPIEDLCAR